jgi:LEA14-like dessication related protein
MRTLRFGIAMTMLVAGVGCALLGKQSFKEPIVSFRDAKITGLGLSGGALEIQLSVYNPNHFRLDGTRLTYNVMVDSVPFGTGAYDQRFTVEEKDSSVVRLPLSFTYAGVGAAGRQLMNMGAVNYRVSGDVTVSTPVGNFTRRYDQTGRFTTLAGSGR